MPTTYEFDLHGVPMKATQIGDSFVDIHIVGIGEPVLFDVLERPNYATELPPERILQIWVDGWASGVRASAARTMSWVRRFDQKPAPLTESTDAMDTPPRISLDEMTDKDTEHARPADRNYEP